MPKITKRSDFVQKILLRAVAVTAIVLAAMFVGAAFSLGAKDDKAAILSESTTLSPLYTLGEYDGKLALFKRGYSMPVEIYDVYLSSLPVSEQGKIKEGISAESDDEILKIIEDYTS